MFTRTRIPKTTNTVVIYGKVPQAYKLASLLIGKEGRIANAPEIVKTKLEHPVDHPIWERYITTSSTEWLGLNKKGVPVIAILHEKAPFSNVEWLQKNYTSNEGRLHVVPRFLFDAVCDGEHGEVTVIPFADVVSFEINRNNHVLDYMTQESVQNCKLLHARIGGNKGDIKRYLDIHRSNTEKNNNQNKRPLIKCDIYEYRENHFFEAYGNTPGITVEKWPINPETQAIASYISIGGRESFSGDRDGGYRSQVCLTGAFCGAHFAAIVNQEAIRLNQNVLRYGAGDYLEKLHQLFIPSPSGFIEEKYYHVVKIKDCYFANEHESCPILENKKNPKHLVKSLIPLGQRTIDLSKKVFYVYEMLFRLIENPEANAYEVIGMFEKNGRDYIKICFYKAEVYLDRQLPNENEIMSPKLLGRII